MVTDDSLRIFAPTHAHSFALKTSLRVELEGWEVFAIFSTGETLSGFRSVNQIPAAPSLVCNRRPENTPSDFDRDTKISVFLITVHT